MNKRLRSPIIYLLVLLLGMTGVTPVQAEAETVQGLPAKDIQSVLHYAQTAGFAYIFDEGNQDFNGTRIVNGTAQDMARLKASQKGTLLVRYKTSSNTNQVLFAAGKDYSNNHYGAILANGVASVNKMRLDFPDGMKANLPSTIVTDNNWHTAVYSVDATDLTNKQGKTVVSFDGSTTTAYPNYASWFNQNADINQIQYLTIGGANGVLASSGNNTNFTGKIAFVAFLPETFTQAEAAELSSSPWPAEPAPIYSSQNVTIGSSANAVALDAESVNRLKQLESATIIIRYKNTNTGIGSLFSISDPSKTNAHFHVYEYNHVIGFEFRNSDNPKYSATGAVYGGEINTVAFKAEKGVGYKLFANGELKATLAKTGAEYQFLNQIPALTAGYLGKTMRSNNVDSYPFTGNIESIEVYSAALSDTALIGITGQTARVPNKVFYAGDATGSEFFRIPFLLATANDTLIAGVDANFGSTGDSAENIDAAIRRKTNASTHSFMEGWENAFIPEALHMKDYADESGYKQKSASFIDGTIVQNTLGSGRIILMIDAFAWNGGVFQHLNVNSSGQANGGVARSVAYGDGFATIGGKKHLLLSSHNMKGNANGQIGNINNNTNRSLFDYAADIYGAKNANGRYNVYHLNGTPRPYSSTSTPVSDDNLSLGALSSYSLNSDYELYKNNQPLTVLQKSKNANHPVTPVPMRIFYEDSELQMYNTSYIMQLYSDDDGVTWHTDKIASGMFKRENSRYYVLGPGRGIQLQKGAHTGRIMMPVYYQGQTSTEVVYSDDGGVTWTHGEPIPGASGLHESTMVEMPDGSVKIFVRTPATSGGKIIMATSVNGGETWQDVKSALGDNAAGVSSQVSALGYSQSVISAADGNPYPALLLSSAYDRARKDGRIFVGLIKEDGTYSDGSQKYRVDWEYQYHLTSADQLYAYSSMTELANGKIGILYESSETASWSDGLKSMYYKEFTMDQLIGNGNP